jgi:hypothetical protein
VIVDLEGADPDALAEALSLTPFEATQRVRRGGLSLWRAVPDAEAEGEVARLGGLGLGAVAVAEGLVRAASRPWVATGGRLEDDALALRGENGSVARVGERDVLLVVKGEIARQYAPDAGRRRSRTATLDPGYRIHLHRRRDESPLELDPGSFDFGRAPVEGSSLLTLLAWLAAAVPRAPSDDRFRHEVPAFAQGEAEEAGPVAAVRSLRQVSPTPTAKGEGPMILDNLAQFRFYSAWRGAVERRRPFRDPR